jgi:serine/threonine protein kinase
MDNFGPEKIFELRAADTSLTSSITTRFQAISNLSAGFGQRSQVVLARNVDEPSAPLSVLKFYDPTFLDPRSYPEGREAACDVFQSAEAMAYRALESLQGNGIPPFQGEYRYRRPGALCMCFCYKVNLLGFVDGVPLGDLHPDSFTVDQRSSLASDAFSLLDKIHQLGVYHHDLIASNLLWNGKSITILNFENVTFCQDAEEDLIREWVALDKGQLMSTLVESVGIEDTRPMYGISPGLRFDDKEGVQ